jgi:hypothetical protein
VEGDDEDAGDFVTGDIELGIEVTTGEKGSTEGAIVMTGSTIGVKVGLTVNNVGIVVIGFYNKYMRISCK